MLIGHQKQWEFLTRAAEAERLSHAFLFSGEEQIGKKTLAVEFAKFLNCLGVQTDRPGIGQKPCQVCQNCQTIAKGVFPDFMLVEPEIFLQESKTPGTIKISQIKKLIERLSLRPYSSSFKIAILDDAHLMNKESQNCFLKILEEPKGRTILFLITQYPETLLPTITSRVQRIKFFPVKNEEIKDFLKNQGFGEKKAEEISLLSLGRPGRALNFYSNPSLLAEEEKLISDIVKISRSDLSFRFQYVKNFLKLPQSDLRRKLEVWLIYFRSLLVSRLGAGKKIGDFSHYPLTKIIRVIKNIQNAEFLISSFNVNPKTLFENLLIDI
jgi:DNA polymerase-3 subunit delta'